MGQGNGEVTKRGRGGRGMENHRGTQRFCRVVVQGGEAAIKGVRASRPQRQHRSPGVGNLFRPRRCVAAAGGTPALRNSSRPARISPGARLCARSTSRSRLAARGASDFNGCPRRFGAAAAGPRRTQPRSVGCGPAALYYNSAISSRAERISPGARASRPQRLRTREGATNFQRPGSAAAAAAGMAALRRLRPRRSVFRVSLWCSQRFPLHGYD